MATDLYLLPPDQWPDERPPPPPATPPRRSAAWLAVLALGAAAGVAAVAPGILRHERSHGAGEVPAAGSESVPSTTPTEAPLATDPARAVYLITVDDCGLQGTGSGFAIDAHHVVTNAHVVRADAAPQLRSPTGDRYVGRVVGITDASRDGHVDPDGTPDVAVIEVDTPLPARLTWASAPPSVGEVLVGMTFPDSVYTPTTGTVVERLNQGFDIRGDFDHGSSGGPVTSRDGHVHGIVTGGVEGGGRAFAFDAGVLRPIVDRMLADPSPVPSDCSAN